MDFLIIDKISPSLKNKYLSVYSLKESYLR
jgi:hypothetical protein